jgi:hypothetical protein
VAGKQVFVFRVGPVGGYSPPRYWYVPTTSEGGAPIVELSTDEEALAKIAADFPDACLECAPDLAETGRRLGFRERPYGTGDLMSRANVAAILAYPRFFTQSWPALAMVRFMLSAARLWNATPVSLGLLRARVRSAGEVMSKPCSPQGELVYVGLSAMIVFPNRTEADQFIKGMTQAQETPQDPGLHEVLVRFVEEPAHAVDAILEAYGLPRLPLPAAEMPQGRCALGTTECWWMSVLMDGLAAAMESGDRHRQVHFEEPNQIVMDTEIDDFQILVQD